jgi:hypothetical protein
MRPPSAPSASLCRNSRGPSSPLRFRAAKSRRGRSPPPSPCCGRNALPPCLNGRAARGRAEGLAGVALPSVGAQVSPSATSRMTNGLPFAARREPPRASRAGGLPRRLANGLRPPRAPLALERASGMPRFAGLCRTAFRSKRRTTSARLSSCPRFSSLRACASSASSLRMISCHLSGISTFRWSHSCGALRTPCVAIDRIRLELPTLSGTRAAGSGAALASVASRATPRA